MAHASFYGLPLFTSPGRVMTPRPATEQLVAAAAGRLGERAARVVDVGTGSGAIAVSLALAAPRAEVWATDLSAAAVLLARANARRFGVSDRVHAVRGDLLDGVPGGLDLIVANLPYLPSADRGRYPELADEPDEAVFAAGDGLGPYRRLLDSAGERLAGDGAVVVQLYRHVLVAERDELTALRAALSGLGRERAGEREPALDPARELALGLQVA
jgi:release factor glutamine methyltransferase